MNFLRLGLRLPDPRPGPEKEVSKGRCKKAQGLLPKEFSQLVGIASTHLVK